MARRQKARPQCLCPHPRGVRGEVEGAYRGDEGRDRGSAAAEGFGQRRWAAAGGEAGQAGKEKINRTVMDVEYSASMTVKHDYLLGLRTPAISIIEMSDLEIRHRQTTY